jgi:hypothetical protein
MQEINNKELLAAVKKDGTIACHFNPTEIKQAIEINNNNKTKYISINAKALQTVVIKP